MLLELEHRKGEYFHVLVLFDETRVRQKLPLCHYIHWLVVFPAQPMQNHILAAAFNMFSHLSIP